MGISFLHSRACGNDIPVRNEDISLSNFLLNQLKNHRILKENKCAFHQIKIVESNGYEYLRNPFSFPLK